MDTFGIKPLCGQKQKKGYGVNFEIIEIILLPRLLLLPPRRHRE